MIEMPTADNPIVLLRGDCLEILPQIPAGAVDAVVTDPPYGVGFKYATHDDGRAAYLATIPKWFAAFPCRNIAVTPGIINVGYWPPARWILAWMKTNSMGASFLSGPNAVSRNLWEPVLWYGNYPPNPPSRDIIHAPILPSDKCDHPCPKPLVLMKHLVEMAAPKGGLVLDPFAGSGTTALACLMTGRRCLAIEIDEQYHAVAKRRIEAYLSSGPLFAGVETQPTLFGGEVTP